MRTAARAATHVVAFLLTLSFVAIGWGKFTDPGWHEVFADWGYPALLVPILGVVEILAGVLVLVPRTRVAGAATLATIMVGALGTHALHGNHPGFPAAQMATIYLVLCLLLLAPHLLDRSRSDS